MLVGVRTWGLLRSLPLLPRLPLLPNAGGVRWGFSEFFEKQDDKQLKDAFFAVQHKKYLHYKMTDHWKKNLERKQRRAARKVELAQQRTLPQPDTEKLVVHNPAVGIEYPPKPDEVFAVVQVDGFQYKVLEDAVLILDTKKEHEINKPIVFSSVPLVGTRTYTLVGRPHVASAYVEAIVESISESSKVIVFKKKRRKNYKRSFGSRLPLTQCRVTRIVHSLSEELKATAIALQ